MSVLLTVSLLGCGTADSSVSEPEVSGTTYVSTSVEEPTPEPVSSYPVTVTDQAGREITIASEPTTLVSGYYIASSLLIALGLKEKVVGIEAKAKQRNIYHLAAPKFLELPSVGTAKEFDLEGCAALKPDLVILPLKLKNAAAQLEELGIKVMLVNPENLELLTEAVEIISKATGTVDKASELLTYISDKQNNLKKELEGTDTPKVYLAGNSSMLSTAGPAMYQATLIETAGGSNAAAEISETYWAEINYEQLLTWNPEYIILASDASYSVDDVLNDANLSTCKAVIDKNVYAIPGDIEALDSPVPASVLASIWLAAILHSDKVTQDEFSAEQTYYYETFYGFTR